MAPTSFTPCHRRTHRDAHLWIPVPPPGPAAARVAAALAAHLESALSRLLNVVCDARQAAGSGASLAAGYAILTRSPSPHFRRDAPLALWTDGSAYENPGPGGYAALIVSPARGPVALGAGGALQDAVAGFHPFTTNIRMELTAIIAALRSLPPGRAPVAVFTDCRSVADGLAGDTRRQAHRDLWLDYEQVRRGRNVIVRWIPAKARLPWHVQADALARRMTAEGYYGGHCRPVDLHLGADMERWPEAAARLAVAE